jgi:hypothetical protein
MLDVGSSLLALDAGFFRGKRLIEHSKALREAVCAKNGRGGGGKD